MFTNGLGGVDTRDLDHNKVKYAKGGMIVTSIKDIPNFKKRLAEGTITYRGLGMGKKADDFYKLAGTSGRLIKVDGKEYYITDTEFDTFSRGSDGKLIIRFDAPFRKFEDGGSVENSSQQLNASLKIQPDFPYKNTANRWLSDHLKHSLKYKLALLLLRGVKDPDDVLNITDTLQYARLLKSLEKAKGESKHEMTFRTDNYTIAEAEEWARESLETMFYVEVDTTKFEDGGAVKRVKMIKESDITEGAKFKLNNGEEIVILNLFTESFGNKWAKYTRNGVEDENTVNQLKNFINNWRAEIK